MAIALEDKLAQTWSIVPALLEKFIRSGATIKREDIFIFLAQAIVKPTREKSMPLGFFLTAERAVLN